MTTLTDQGVIAAAVQSFDAATRMVNVGLMLAAHKHFARVVTRIGGLDERARTVLEASLNLLEAASDLRLAFDMRDEANGQARAHASHDGNETADALIAAVRQFDDLTTGLDGVELMPAPLAMQGERLPDARVVAMACQLIIACAVLDRLAPRQSGEAPRRIH